MVKTVEAFLACKLPEGLVYNHKKAKPLTSVLLFYDQLLLSPESLVREGHRF